MFIYIKGNWDNVMQRPRTESSIEKVRSQAALRQKRWREKVRSGAHLHARIYATVEEVDSLRTEVAELRDIVTSTSRPEGAHIPLRDSQSPPSTLPPSPSSHPLPPRLIHNVQTSLPPATTLGESFPYTNVMEMGAQLQYR